MKTKIALFRIALLIACFSVSQNAVAVTPSPDGGYPGGNTAEGDNALLNLTSGSYDTAIGWNSLQRNTEGNFNTAVGAGAMLFNATANENTATGTGALLVNAPPFSPGGNGNTANGAFALFKNSTGSFNTGIGDRTLFNNTTGNFNTAVGSNALANNTTGNGNIALGNSAGSNVTTASNVICIGSAGSNSTNNACFISNIFGVSGINGVQMFISASGKVGAPGSSRRFKEDIKPMEHASEALFALKPVTFRYKKEIDSAGSSQFGLVAEDVEKVNSELVVRDKEGKPYSVRYEAVNAMLLNEFLKEHRKVEELSSIVATKLATIADLKSTVAQQQKGMEVFTARLNEQAAQIQKVSAQLEASKPAPQVVNNP
jgi:hypothetical protein